MNNYWQYLVQTAMKPSSSFANTNALMDWIQIAVLSLLTSKVLAIFLSEAYITVQFIDFIKVLFIQVIASLCPILMAFLVVRFIKKNPITFFQATAQMGGLLSLNVFILALVFVFSLLSPIGLTGIINVVAVNVYLYSTDNHSKVDSFIATIIGNVGYLVLVMIIVRIFLSMFLEGVSSTSFLELLSNLMY